MARERTLATRSFSLGDQRRFAAFSGDRNPMHLDPLAARRTQAGSPVVHGVHAALWAIDALAAGGYDASGVTNLAVRFKRFLYLDRPIVASVRDGTSGARLTLAMDGKTCATIDLQTAPRPDGDREPIVRHTAHAAPHVANEIAFADARDVAGTLETPPASEARDLFPDACAALGAAAVGGLAACSTIVGMIVPGLHSVFDGIDVALRDDVHARALGYAVRAADDRFGSIEIGVRGSGLDGTCTAFFRQPPVRADAAAFGGIGASEFAQTRALVIGGSRGIGAAVVRALAAGGARVAFTYFRGEDDARALVAQCGAETTCSRYDASDPGSHSFSPPFDHVYYFATPQIARQRTSWYDDALFAEFCATYVAGFASLCALVYDPKVKTRVYYPSSIAVDPSQRPREMLEYAMAKSAGEALCADLGRALPGLTIEVERLPRILTDQTATIVPVEAASAATYAIAAVRRMHRAGTPTY